MKLLGEPKISWWDIDNLHILQINPDLFGKVRKGEKSEIIKFLMWNNRGGDEDVSNTSWDFYTDNRDLLGYAGCFHIEKLNDIDDFLSQGWIHLIGFDRNTSDAEIAAKLEDDYSKVIGNFASFPFTCAAGVKDFISGKANTGTLNNLSNYAMLAMQVFVPDNATLGKRNFSFYWQMK